MKKRRFLLLAATCVLAASLGAFAACGEEETPAGTGGNETPHTHSYEGSTWTITVKPTLETAGKAQRSCVGGDYNDIVDIPALSDSTVWTVKTDATVAPTHTADGKTVYTSVYGDVEVTVTKLPHTFGAWSIVEGKKPTSAAGGQAERKCTENDSGRETYDLPALTDSFWKKDEEASTPATHTAPGTNVYKNAEYNLTVDESVAPNADAHTYGEWSWKDDVEPTLEAGATAVHTCTDPQCTDPTQEVEVPELTDAEVWTKETTKSPSHTENGEDTYTSVYGEVKVETDKVGAHQWGEWSWVGDTEATTDSGAKIEHSCTIPDCGATEQFDVAALSSTEEWESAVTPATHNEAGSAVYTHKTHEGLTVTVVLDKLVAPYDSKTYVAFSLDASEEEDLNKAISYYRWNGVLSLDANAVGYGHASPFTNGSKFTITMVDPATGEISIEEIEGSYGTEGETDAENWIPDDPEVKTTVTGYVDMETGIFLLPNNSQLNYVHVCIPEDIFDADTASENSKASAWGTLADFSMAISYTDKNGTTHNIFIRDNAAYFVDAFENEEGAVAANAAYNSDYLFVKKGGENLFSFGYTEGKMVELDEFYGTYTTEGTVSLGSLKLSGYGTFTAGEEDATSGTYEVVGNKLGLYVVVDGAVTEYYEVALDGETYTAEKPMVTLTLHSDQGEIEDSVTWNKNVPQTLPEGSEVEGFAFRGWFTDSAYEEPVELTDGKYIPTEDGDLYAKWAQTLTVSVWKDGKEEGSSTQLTVAEGDNILEALDALLEGVTFDPVKGTVFRGWWYTFEEAEAQVTYLDTFGAETADIVFYAKWETVPYIGDFKGNNLYSSTSGGPSTSSSYYVNIAANGDVYFKSASVTGHVTNYDPDTGIITWTKTGEDTPNYFFYNEALGAIAVGHYSATTNDYITHDMMFAVRDGWEDGSLKHFAIKVPSPKNSGGSQDYYARFVEYTDKTEKAEKHFILLYGNKIYSGITVTNGLGESLTLEEIKMSRSVVVKQGDTVILARGATKADNGDKLGNNANTESLDSFYGSYTAAEGSAYEKKDVLKLDGAGTAQWGDITGSYTVVDANEKIVGVTLTLEETPTYFEIALTQGTANTYTVDGPKMITLNLDDAHGTESYEWSGSVNQTIQVVLPTPTNAEGWLFRGWYLDDSFEHALQTNDGGAYVYTPVTDGTTIYAKWVARVTVTVHYNDESATEDLVVDDLGGGETLELPRPSYPGHKFGGWFSDVTLETAWGTMNDSTHITSAELVAEEPTTLDLYAKWEGAPAYADEYVLYTLTGENSDSTENGKAGTSHVVIGPEGEIDEVSGLEFPFNGDTTVQKYDPATGEFEIHYHSTYSDHDYKGYFDANKGIIVLTTATSRDDNFYLLVKIGVSIESVVSSYWKKGAVRAITITIGGEQSTTVNVFTKDKVLFYDVTFVNYEGTTVKAEEAYTQENFYAKKGEDVVGSYGFNGTKMVELDGKEGSYTHQGEENDLGTLFFTGAGVVKGTEKQGTYTAVSDKDYDLEMYYDGAFYYVTLSDNGGSKLYSAVKPMATVTFDFGNVPRGTYPETKQYNLNIEAVIEKPVVDGYVFLGWYNNKSGSSFYETYKLSQNEDGEWVYTPKSDAVTLYAYLKAEVTVHVHYNREGILQDYDFIVAESEKVNTSDEWKGDPDDIVEGQKFLGWYSDVSLQEEWSDTYPVQAELHIYAKWLVLEDVNYMNDDDHPWTNDPAAGTWTSASGFSSDSSVLEILFGAEGTYSFDWYVSSEGGSYDHLTITLVHGSSSDDIVYQQGGYNRSEKSGHESVEVVVGDILRFTYKKDSSGDHGDDLARISNIEWEKTIYDEWAGTYTGDKGEETNEDLVLDGKGGASWAGRHGGYVVKEGNVIGITLEPDGGKPAEYWEVTLVKGDANTYTATMPMVTVKFVLGDETLTQGDLQYNANIPVALPDVVDEATHKYVSGWYEEADYQTSVLGEDGLFVPAGENGTEITVYGKVETMVKLTLNYNGHGPSENKELWLKKGATPDLSEEAPEDTASEAKNYFTGWYNEEGCTTAYEPAPLSEDKVVYAGWSTTPYSVEISNKEGTEKWQLQGDGSYRIDAGKGAKSYIVITFKASGTFKFDWSCQYTDAEDYGDGLLVTVNKDPNQASYGDKKFTAKTGSGTGQEIAVQAGDVLYIASMIYVSSYATTGDFAQVSNFNFVAD